MNAFYIEDFKRFVIAKNLEVKTQSEILKSLPMDLMKAGSFDELKENEKVNFNAAVKNLGKWVPFEITKEDLSKSIVFASESDVEKQEVEERGEYGQVIKARGGIYSNTYANRKAGRVGQKYGSKKEENKQKNVNSFNKLEIEFSVGSENGKGDNKWRFFDNNDNELSLSKVRNIAKENNSIKEFESWVSDYKNEEGIGGTVVLKKQKEENKLHQEIKHTNIPGPSIKGLKKEIIVDTDNGKMSLKAGLKIIFNNIPATVKGFKNGEAIVELSGNKGTVEMSIDDILNDSTKKERGWKRGTSLYNEEIKSAVRKKFGMLYSDAKTQEQKDKIKEFIRKFKKENPKIAAKKPEENKPKLNFAAKRLMDGLQTSNSKYKDINKVSAEATPKGNWRLYYDNKDTGITWAGDLLSDATIEKYQLQHFDNDESIRQQRGVDKKQKEKTSSAFDKELESTRKVSFNLSSRNHSESAKRIGFKIAKIKKELAKNPGSTSNALLRRLNRSKKIQEALAKEKK